MAPVSAAFSIGTLDERVWRETEPGTPHPKARMEAVRTLTDAGIPTGDPDGADPARHLRPPGSAARGGRCGDRRGSDPRLADHAASPAGRSRGVPPVAGEGAPGSRRALLADVPAAVRTESDARVVGQAGLVDGLSRRRNPPRSGPGSPLLPARSVSWCEGAGVGAAPSALRLGGRRDPCLDGALQLFPGVVAGSDQRPRLDVGDPHLLADPLVLGELIGLDPAVDGQVVRGRLQVLAHREDVDAGVAEVGHRGGDLVGVARPSPGSGSTS